MPKPGHCDTYSSMAGHRYRNYFPDRPKQSAFNKTKYKRYYFYLEAKGFLTLFSLFLRWFRVFDDFHGNVHTRNSRSRAGAISQTRVADLVVSARAPGILLSSVFLFPHVLDY